MIRRLAERGALAALALTLSGLAGWAGRWLDRICTAALLGAGLILAGIGNFTLLMAAIWLLAALRRPN